jgi:hypothetical protein
LGGLWTGYIGVAGAAVCAKNAFALERGKWKEWEREERTQGYLHFRSSFFLN